MQVVKKGTNLQGLHLIGICIHSECIFVIIVIILTSQEWNKLGVQWFWFSAVDFKSPNLKDINKCLQIIQDCKGKSETVYIHCKSGRGRSVIVTACYLVKVSLK